MTTWHKMRQLTVRNCFVINIDQNDSSEDDSSDSDSDSEIWVKLK